MISQYEPYIKYGNLHAEISRYLLSGSPYLTEFKKTAELEKQIAEFLGVKHCYMVSNGTISLSLALMAAGIKAGDMVACPALSMIASSNAIRFIGAEPVFFDVTEDLTLNLNEILKGNTDFKAIMYVSLNGVFNTAVPKWAVMAGIPVIEDNAQSFGSKYRSEYKDHFVGNTYEISSFSFSMPKIIGCGQGGCLTTNSDLYADKIKKLKDFGRTSGGLDIHDEFGINAKISEFQSITLLDQMKDIDWRIARKKEMYHLYGVFLGIANENFHLQRLDTTVTTPWFITLLCKRREELIAHLKSKGIGTRPIYGVMPHQKCYSDHPQHTQSFPVAENVAKHGLWLPSSLTLTNDQIEQICGEIVSFYNRT